MTILQAHVVVQQVVTQHETALPTSVQVEVKEGLLLAVPVAIGSNGIANLVVIKSFCDGHVPPAVVVVDVYMGLCAQREGALAQGAAVVHTQDIVVELLLVAVLVQGDDLAGVLAVPCAVVVEPYTQFLALLVQDAVTKIYPEVGLRARTHVQIAALGAEVVRRAVAVGEQRGNRGWHINGRGQVAVAQLGLSSRCRRLLDLG